MSFHLKIVILMNISEIKLRIKQYLIYHITITNSLQVSNFIAILMPIKFLLSICNKSNCNFELCHIELLETVYYTMVDGRSSYILNILKAMAHVHI